MQLAEEEMLVGPGICRLFVAVSKADDHSRWAHAYKSTPVIVSVRNYTSFKCTYSPGHSFSKTWIQPSIAADLCRHPIVPGQGLAMCSYAGRLIYLWRVLKVASSERKPDQSCELYSRHPT
jgi:hypothetical protein